MRRSLLLTTAALGVAMMPLGAAEAQTPFDWAGLYFGLHAGHLTGNVTGVDGGSPIAGTMSGFIGGALVGYNFQPSGPFVFGVEGDFGVAAVTGTGTSTESDTVSDLYTYELNWNKHLRVRAGMPIGNLLPFVAGGLALADFNLTETRDPMTIGGLFAGITVGAGVDAMFGPSFIGRAEVLYDAYGSKTYDEYTVRFDTWTVRVAAIFKLP